MQYLGHIVRSERVATDPAKLEVVEWLPVPHGVQELQGFLGNVGYYQQYILRFATIAKPRHRLVGKEKPWQWTGKEQAAFDTLHHSLTTALVLGYSGPGINPYSGHGCQWVRRGSCVVTAAERSETGDCLL